MSIHHDHELHKKAFEVYYQTRNKSQVARECGVTMQAVNNWVEKTYPCRFGCPYHGWEELIAEKERALTAQVKLLETGVHDPVQIENAMKEAAGNPTFDRMFAVKQIVRSDLSRVADYEYLYAKVFFHITQIAITPDQVEGIVNGDQTAQDYADKYSKGLIVTNMRDGMSILNGIVDKIKQLKIDLGGAQDKESDNAEIVTIEELRTLRKTTKSLSSTQLSSMMNKKFEVVDEQTVNEQMADLVPREESA